HAPPAAGGGQGRGSGRGPDRDLPLGAPGDRRRHPAFRRPDGRRRGVDDSPSRPGRAGVRAGATARAQARHTGHMRRLRIAWLGHQSARLGGGMATYSHEVVAGLRRRGQQVTFFHHGDPSGEGGGESPESVALASVNVPLVKPLVLSPGRAKKKLIDRLRQPEFDLVHASFWFSSMDFDLPKLTRELSIPLVATFHVAFDTRLSLWGGITSGTYRLYAPTLAKCDRVIVFGPGQRDILVNLGVPEAILRILPNGVDVDKHSPGPSDRRERFGARRLFTYMGRVDSEKNVDILLEAC